MKIPGLLEINKDIKYEDITDYNIINLTFTDQQAPRLLSELGLIREIRYFKALFKTILKDLELNKDENVAIVSPSLDDLIFNLAILCAINNKNIEYIENEMYYTGQLRRNIHISDTCEGFSEIALEDEDVFYDDDELNLEKYDADDFDD